MISPNAIAFGLTVVCCGFGLLLFSLLLDELTTPSKSKVPPRLGGRSASRVTKGLATQLTMTSIELAQLEADRRGFPILTTIAGEQVVVQPTRRGLRPEKEMKAPALGAALKEIEWIRPMSTLTIS